MPRLCGPNLTARHYHRVSYHLANFHLLLLEVCPSYQNPVFLSMREVDLSGVASSLCMCRNPKCPDRSAARMV